MTRSKSTKTPSISDGETLVSEYEERLAVRQQRDSSGQAATIREDEARNRASAQGRQTTPELAKLASEYMTHEDPNVRRLAASVLGQVNE